MSNAKRPWGLIVVVVIAVLSVATYLFLANHKTADVEAKTVARAAHDVLADAKKTADFLDTPYVLKSMRAEPCKGPQGKPDYTVYNVLGSFHFVPKTGDLNGVVAKVHDHWKSRGWQITEYRHAKDADASVSATEPSTDTDYEFTALNAVGLINAPITTGCFRDRSLKGVVGEHISGVPTPSSSPPPTGNSPTHG
ncbi:MAG TPA: hypothetical protein VE172_03080 [Stackebrandtia sp.]|jgi:hypothetical protein|uniref:hypothetical protein n=1 Tax=Stackebrandtia sp. TaxID=2023065 RepID=UPI002D7383D5|nr:hypothetical protein [Stackebrandtia sp.]HZE37771.1 hypothetical protein [Stackebrandtia sp.]